MVKQRVKRFELCEKKNNPFAVSHTAGSKGEQQCMWIVEGHGSLQKSIQQTKKTTTKKGTVLRVTKSAACYNKAGAFEQEATTSRKQI